MSKTMTNIIFLAFMLIFFIFLFNVGNKIDQTIFNDGFFTIGTIVRYKKSNHTLGSSSGYVYFYFDKNNKKQTDLFVKTGKLTEQQKNTIKEGDKYFVIYLAKEGSLIFFDKPIKDSSDFKKYVTEFEQKRNIKD